MLIENYSFTEYLSLMYEDGIKNPKEFRDNLERALEFATEKHKGQIRRGSGLPYVTHPILVKDLITHYKGNSKNKEALQIAALLHDTLEDTNTTYREIEREFGSMVSKIVKELTSDEKRLKKVGKNNYLKTKMLGMSNYAFILKLVDRLSNVKDNPSERYVDDTIVMMNYLLKNRKGITSRQEDIINDILDVCKEFKKSV